jgi:hypothetical protein
MMCAASKKTIRLLRFATCGILWVVDVTFPRTLLW